MGYPPALKIGILEDNDLLPAIEAAVEDINQSVRKMKPSPPLVRISRISSSASITEEFQRLHDSEGIRVFIATSKKSLDEVKSFVRYRPQYYSEAVIVSLISTSDDEDHFQKIATMNLKEEARGYLALIESNNPGNKTLDVVPVWENLPEVAELYEVYKSEIAASYPNSISFTLPVTYEASKYPRSDGMQAVSEISSRLVLHPNAHIFFLTSSRLTEVIESSSMNKALSMLKSRHGRHWYVRGLVEDEAVLNNLEINAKDFAQQTSLTTLTFMASADTLETVEMLKRSMNHEVGIVGGSRKQSSSTDDESSTRPPSSAQTYLRARAYSIVYGLHKSFTTSILQQKSLKSVLLLRKNPDDNNNKNEEKSIILASLTFHATRPQILPLNNWIVSNLVSSEATAATIEDGGNSRPNKKFKVEPIYTYPLPRHELQTLMSGLKAQEECARPRIQLWLHPSIIMPHISLGFSDLQSIPEVMVLPAQKGISVTFQCSQRASITAYCMPTKFNRGQMTCRLLAASEVDANIGGPPEIAAHSESKMFRHLQKQKKKLQNLKKKSMKNARFIY